MDDPTDKGDYESVGQVFNFLTELSDKHVHRSCSMKNIHYPVDIQTTAGQSEVEGGLYQKNAHSVQCSNLYDADKEVMKKLRPEPPYYWDNHNVTCRDWKIRYCCANLWGEPGLYGLIAKTANENTDKKVPKYISKTDVFVDKPTRATLFEDCEWGNFIRYDNLVLQATVK